MLISGGMPARHYTPLLTSPQPSRKSDMYKHTDKVCDQSSHKTICCMGSAALPCAAQRAMLSWSEGLEFPAPLRNHRSHPGRPADVHLAEVLGVLRVRQQLLHLPLHRACLPVACMNRSGGRLTALALAPQYRLSDCSFTRRMRCETCQGSGSDLGGPGGQGTMITPGSDWGAGPQRLVP